ncbi:MAG: hypothetical protein RO469_05375 [Thermincola sp.]|nr:hypothetical protein [Thermincola sp.]MDT3703014.1 hypothetical protein [Thermincola sp.]
MSTTCFFRRHHCRGTAAVTRYATGEMFIAIGSVMVFSLAGVGLFLFLILTGTDRRKLR